MDYCTLIFFLNILNLLESKYSNKFISKNNGDLSKLEPYKKQDYINIINYETNDFIRRSKDHWQENDDVVDVETDNEPQVYFLKSIIKNKLENSNNNLCSVLGLNQFYKPEFYGSVGTLNHSNEQSLPQQLAKRNSLNSNRAKDPKELQKYIQKPTPFKIWVEEYNNNEMKKYVTYIDVNKETIPFLGEVETVLASTPTYKKQTKKSSIVHNEPIVSKDTTPFLREVETVLESTLSFEKQTKTANRMHDETPVNKETIPLSRVIETFFESTFSYKIPTKSNIPYITPPANNPVKEDGNKFIMAKRNFPVLLSAFKWKSKDDKINKPRKTTLLKHQEMTENLPTISCTTKKKQTTKPKSVMDKLNEINLDDKCTKKTTTPLYSEKFCGTETETPITFSTTTKGCRNYTGIILCPNCGKKLRYDMQVINNGYNTINPTLCSC